MKILMLGPPGSGKGYLGKRLVSYYDLNYISMSDCLKKNVEAKEYIESSKLVPDEIVINSLKEYFKQNNISNNYLIDGYPRTIEQANELEKISPPNIVINLMIDDKKVIDRISSRIICKKCKTIYSTKGHIPKKEGYCDFCNSKLSIRLDDNKLTITKRLNDYHKEIKDIIMYYSKKEILKNIDTNTNNAELNIKKAIEKTLNIENKELDILINSSRKPFYKNTLKSYYILILILFIIYLVYNFKQW